jgi:hypothetical protein
VIADGQRIEADNVVVATGTFGRTPYVPDFAADLDPSILQLHSSEYRRPEQLQPLSPWVTTRGDDHGPPAPSTAISEPRPGVRGRSPVL